MAWEEIRHQVAIAGRVTERLPITESFPDEETGEAIGRALVKITDAPAAFITTVVIRAKGVASNDPATAAQRAVLDDPTTTDTEKLQAAQAILDCMQARRAASANRPDLIRTAVDGHFHFLDLPDGAYTLTVSLPGSGSRYGTAQVDVTVTSSMDDGERDIDMVEADIALPPTSLTGRITAEDSGDPVVMAEVRVKGSGEYTFSGDDGAYVLAGLETGARTVQVSARGYRSPGPQAVDFIEAGEEKVLNLELDPVSAGG